LGSTFRSIDIDARKYTENKNLSFKKFVFADNSSLTANYGFLFNLSNYWNKESQPIKPETTRVAIIHDKTDDKDHLYMNGDNKLGQLGNDSKTKSDE